jgi:hypothetical protein
VLEIDRLGEPIGKQDQYAAAYGGMNLIEFEPHGGVTVQPLLLAAATLSELEGNLMLFFTGTQRNAGALLSHQVAAIGTDATVASRMQQMVELAYEMRDLLLAGDLDAFGMALHRGWEQSVEFRFDWGGARSPALVASDFGDGRAAGTAGLAVALHRVGSVRICETERTIGRDRDRDL